MLNKKEENMKDKIIELLLNKLSYAYCDNCGTEDCDECHRKYQSWSLSKNTANDLATEILNLINREEK